MEFEEYVFCSSIVYELALTIRVLLLQIEGLHEELDFKTKITRAELESLSKDLLDRIRGPIDTVLKTAKMKVVCLVLVYSYKC